MEESTPRRREVAVTFDDVPAQPPRRSTESLREITEGLLAAITKNAIPALGFVNEGVLYNDGELDTERTALLKMWVDAGLELGNHTFSHLDLNRSPLAAYLNDIIRGETITRSLIEERGGELTYFRPPYLHTGKDLETKVALEQFLRERGYTVVPVTIDSQEWAFGKVYDRAWECGDESVMRRIAETYVPYMEKMFEFFEEVSVELLGYEVKQILLLHASALNAHHFDALVGMIKRRGYTFISTAQAMADSAYSLPDNIINPKEQSAFHQWASGMGRKMRQGPTEPEFVMELYKASFNFSPQPMVAPA